MENVNNLENLIDYQKDSIVSKEIVKNQSGTVTLFAFDEGQGLSEHTAPFEALVYVVDGKADVSISGENQEVSKGEIILLPANKPHALQAKGRFKMLLTMIKGHLSN